MSETMNDQVKEIRKIAKDLLTEKKVDILIGFEKATVPAKSRPCFLYTDDLKDGEGNIDPVKADAAADRLIWDSFCTNNLAAFLQKHFENVPNRRKKREEPYPTIGVVVKGCDLRSIVALQKERQVVRENLVLIGVPCRGMIDRRKVTAAVEEQGEEAAGHMETAEGMLKIACRSGKELQFAKDDYMQTACAECRYPMPENTDYTIPGEAKKPGDGGYARIREFEELSNHERWDYFKKEMSKCIRCNACRQACPTCWCKECFADHTDLKWIGVGNDLTDAMIFQIVRIFHQAGRCVECDACYNACPMGIDLRTYTKKIVKDVDEVFGYVPGFDTETLPPLSTFSEQDTDFFITDPEKK